MSKQRQSKRSRRSKPKARIERAAAPSAPREYPTVAELQRLEQAWSQTLDALMEYATVGKAMVEGEDVHDEATFVSIVHRLRARIVALRDELRTLASQTPTIEDATPIPFTHEEQIPVMHFVAVLFFGADVPPVDDPWWRTPSIIAQAIDGVAATHPGLQLARFDNPQPVPLEPGDFVVGDASGATPELSAGVSIAELGDPSVERFLADLHSVCLVPRHSYHELDASDVARWRISMPHDVRAFDEYSPRVAGLAQRALELVEELLARATDRLHDFLLGASATAGAYELEGDPERYASRLYQLWNKLTHEAASPAAPVAPTYDSIPTDALLSASELAEKFDLPAERLRKRLERLRGHNHAAFVEVPEGERGMREAKYRYRWWAARPVVEDLQKTRS